MAVVAVVAVIGGGGSGGGGTCFWCPALRAGAAPRFSCFPPPSCAVSCAVSCATTNNDTCKGEQLRVVRYWGGGSERERKR